VKSKKGTVRYTASEIEDMRRKGGDRTDAHKLDRMTEPELMTAARDEGGVDWSRAEIGIPGPKQQLTVRLDRDVVHWFRSQGPGYQTRMNAVLRRFVEAQKGQHR
jgi:uncharacterized protein (DUF4415 family)